MKVKKIELLALGLVSALCTQISLADQSSQSTSPSKDSVTLVTASVDGNFRLSKLIGADVKSTNGEDLGRVDDLIMDSHTGKITFAIVGRGGLLGLGEKRRAVPWQQVKINSEKEVSLNVDREKFASAPTVSSDYADLNDLQTVATINRFYGIEPVGAAEETPGGTGKGTQRSPDEPVPQK